MRALVQYGYGGSEVLRLEERETPEPGPDEVRVKVLACGVNGSDWEYISGHPFYARMAGGSPKGRVLGSDICGEIEAIGPGVQGLSVGQIVVGETLGVFGGFADQAVAKADLWVPVPDGMDPVTAAALPQPGGVALSGVGDFVQAGQSVLINGAGGACGSLAVQIALNAGANVTAIDSAEKLDPLRALGAHQVMDYRVDDFATHTARYDLVLDLWGTRPMHVVRRVLKPEGRYLLVGGPMWRVVCIGIGGSIVSRFTKRKSTLLLAELGAKRVPEVLAMAQDGRIRAIVAEVAKLADAKDALARAGAGQIAGKLVICP